MTLPYSHPSILQINFSAIEHNYKILSQSVEKTEIAWVLKANAYGLGLKEIASFFSPYIKTVFVAYSHEAIIVRDILPDANIYVLHGSILGNIEDFLKYNLIPVINTMQQLDEWKNDITGTKKHPFALQFDTGMSRFGLSEEDVQSLKSLNLKPILVMSHLACADDHTHPLNEQQYQKFLYYSSFFPEAKKSLAASSGIFLDKKYHFDMVRPGAALYGINPYKNAKNPLENVIELSVSLQQAHMIKKGQGVGYGHQWIAPKDTYVGTFNIGYADGISRNFSQKGKLFYDGEEIPIIGHISMDSLSADLSNLKEKNPQIGNFFKLIYKEQDIHKIAQELNTIPYEILTSLGQRFKKIYLKDI